MWTERRALIAEIEKIRGSRVICYLTSDRQNANAIIAKDALPNFHSQLRKIGEVPKLDLFLYTTGGDTLAAFNIARLLREFSKWIGVLIPSRCFSAGTLLAIGADQIYMTRAGTLSPIDPSVTTNLNPAVEGSNPRQLLPVSVESVAGFKSLIEEDWKIDDERMLTDLFKVLAEKVHPLALGDVYRSRQQIAQLAHQLMKRHRSDEKNIKKVILTLTRGLGSHDYPISRTDAKELLGSQIAPHDERLETLISDLLDDFRREMELGDPYNAGAILARAREQAAPNVPVQGRASLQMAVIESSEQRDVFEQTFTLGEAIIPGPSGPRKVVQQEVLFAGWKNQKMEGATQ